MIILFAQFRGLFGAGLLFFDLADFVLAQAVVVEAAAQVGLETCTR